MKQIYFNRPYKTGNEFTYINEAYNKSVLSGNGDFTKRCHQALADITGSPQVLLTHSCTAALEMSAILLDLKPDDEVIMPSYTFVSTANAVVLRGAIPVFVDIRPDTMNIDETLIEAAITPRTRAIMPVHYAGVGCEMDTIMAIADRRGLTVVEDAAQGIMATYKGRPLGSIGTFGTYSFHDTKNITCGEGGALLINDAAQAALAEIVWEKGTDRSQFIRGEVDKYTWRHVGSSFLPGEITAAFLYAQLEKAQEITAARLNTWNRYHALLEPLEAAGLIGRPIVPDECQHNAHMYYIMLPDTQRRAQLIDDLKNDGIMAIFHYIPLHSSQAGKEYGRTCGNMTVTDQLSSRLLRLPLWNYMEDDTVDYVAERLQVHLHAALRPRPCANLSADSKKAKSGHPFMKRL